MDFTVEQLTELRAAYATGAMIVKHGDKTTEFRSLNEMKKLIVAIEKNLSNSTPSRKNFLGGRAITPQLKDS